MGKVEQEKESRGVSESSLLGGAGLSALASGLLFLVADCLFHVYGLIEPQQDIVKLYTAIPNVAGYALYLLADVLLVVGLFGLYVSQWKEAGVLGVVGGLLALAGQTLTYGFEWNAVFILPALVEESDTRAAFSTALGETVHVGSILSYVAFAIGWFVFGIATFRAGVYRRVPIVLLLLGLVVLLLFEAVFPFAFRLPNAVSEVGLLLGATLFNVALIWLGYSLFATKRGESVSKPPRT